MRQSCAEKSRRLKPKPKTLMFRLNKISCFQWLHRKSIGATSQVAGTVSGPTLHSICPGLHEPSLGWAALGLIPSALDLLCLTRLVQARLPGLRSFAVFSGRTGNPQQAGCRNCAALKASPSWLGAQAPRNHPTRTPRPADYPCVNPVST